MNNFVTRLVERTLGLSEVVQPVVASIFGNEMTMEDGFPMTPPLDEKTLDLEEEIEGSEFPITETSLLRTDILSESPAPNETIGPEKCTRSPSLTDNQPDLKNKVLKETDKEFEFDSLPSKQRVRGEVSPQSNKPENHASPSSDRNTKEVISAQIETSENMDLSEKRDTGDIMSGNVNDSSMHSPESPSLISRLQDTDTEAHFLTSLAFEKSISRDVSFKQQQTGPAIVEHHSAERKRSSRLPAIKVTIGRIDVRAVKQQAPSLPQPRKIDPKPRLSLDDYLKQRNGGPR